MKSKFGYQQRRATTYGRVGVDVSEMARNIAKQMRDAAERNAKEQREQERSAQYTPREEWYCLARWIHGNAAMAETIEPVLARGIFHLKAYAPTPEAAVQALHWEFAKLLFQRKLESDFEAAKRRSQEAKFYLAEVINQRPGA